jgi:colanic acid/amylovoran biosynthesis glycosyltransferase
VPDVIIWRSQWLPWSETFILNQIKHFQDWSALPVAIDAGTPPPKDPYFVRRPDRLERFRFKLTRHDRTLQDAIAGAKADLVHAHFGTDGVLIAPTAERLGLPLITTFHGADATQCLTSSNPRLRFYQLRAAELIRSGSLAIAVSSFIRDRLISAGALDDRTIVHHMGVSVSAVAEFSEQDEIKSGKIVAVGRLVEKKGFDDLIVAVSLLPERWRATQVNIIGEGPEREKLEQLAKKLRVNVVFHGRLDPAGVGQQLRAGDVFCAPSKTAANGDSEGLPTTILEAAAAGTAILSTKHAGIPDFVIDGMTGILTSEGDRRAIALGLCRLLDDRDLRRKLVKNADSRLRNFFDISKQSQVLEGIYHDEVDRHLRGRQVGQ